ncbi:MAG: 4-alpha-glucanotransferase, partial [Anaerolineales bacterium]
RYLVTHEPLFAWDLLRTAWASVAIFALAPMQDVLGLGGWARMNYPSRPDGNWAWRMEAGAFSEEIIQRLREWNYLYSR